MYSCFITCQSDLPPVKVVMDIMPQHHGFLKGPKGSNIQEIVKRTGAKIDFPKSEATERRAIDISGNLDCVYVAWQEIMVSYQVFYNILLIIIIYKHQYKHH